MLHASPDRPLAQLLVDNLGRRPAYQRFCFAVAWARKRGVQLLSTALEQFPGESLAVVGLNDSRTSYEALVLLFQRLTQLWVFFKHPLQTFHPKLYTFFPDPDGEPDSGLVISGSSNLTSGGLYSNFEASWAQRLSPLVPSESVALQDLTRYFDSLISSPFCHLVTSEAYLSELLAARYVRTEANIRAATRRTLAARPGGHVGLILPEAPPPVPPAVPDIPVALPIADHAEPDMPAPVPHGPGGHPIDTLFYVRTLTENDVLKALRQREGTWEPDLGLTARNEHPDFWGWPANYLQVGGTDRLEWQTQALFCSSRSPTGSLQTLRLWFRPEREDHAAEHRIRPASAVRDLVVPPELDTRTLMVVQRLPNHLQAAFRIDFILPTDPRYTHYVPYMTTQRPEHRFGYGTVAPAED